jgi:hypothetical protein
MKPFAHPLAMLALVVICGCSRPDPKPPVAAPITAQALVAPAPAPASPPREPGPYETPRPVGGREATPLPDLRKLGADEPGEPPPKAGRQVLRCVVKGRYAYLDLNSSCPEGPGERVTVFPTEGVELPR